jgi:hypothetical protein
LFYLTGVGSKTFIEEMKDALGFRATGRKIIGADDTFELRELMKNNNATPAFVPGNMWLS